MREAQAAQLEAKKPDQGRLNIVLSLIGDCEAEADTLAKSIKKAKGLVAVSLERDQDELNQRYKALAVERNKLGAKVAAIVLTDDDIAEALQFREDVRAGMAAPTFEDKRRVIENLQITARIEKNGKVTIESKIPTLRAGVIDTRIPTNC